MIHAGDQEGCRAACKKPAPPKVFCGTLLQKCLDQGPDTWHASKISRGDLQTTFLFKGFEEVCHPACLVFAHYTSLHQ